MLRLALAAAIVLSGAPAAGAGQEPPVEVLADRLRAYLETTEPLLGALVAEERFEQSITGVSETGTTQLPTRRVLVSEIGFVRLADEHAWLAHRRVQTVNGRPVGGAPRLADLFTRTGPDQLAIARLIAGENARHNLGHPRTTNVPTLPLDLLHPRHRSAYAVRMGGIERRDGGPLARLEFSEGARGTLVAHDDRSFVRTVVLAWVEVESGALRQAEVTLVPPVAARENHVVRVEFEWNQTLGVRVPALLTERFWAGGAGEGKATYRRYRRFDTAARVVPPPP